MATMEQARPSSRFSSSSSSRRKGDAAGKEEINTTTTPGSSSKKKRGGLLSRLRRSKRADEASSSEGTKKDASPTPEYDDKRDPTPSTSTSSSTSSTSSSEEEDIRARSVTREGVPVVSSQGYDDFVPSQVRETAPTPNPAARETGPSPATTSGIGSATKKKGAGTKRAVLDKMPSARTSAFSGPPRYDWIDIETAACIKIQSMVRRHQTVARLERKGISTAAMRNKKRARAAGRGLLSRNGGNLLQVSEDAPGLLACCGVGLLFGDATQEEREVQKAWERQAYEDRKRQQEERELQLRDSYFQAAAAKKSKPEQHLQEALEVVDH